jgi:hypothetical protein
MTEVYAVKIADGRYAARMMWLQIIKTPDKLH